ncbi:MAG: apolipoprotein N-acyltransferase, partial [Pseudomonadales bacterium]|nr:apolipoprotein N-acyltransferase [Pseudomonadales bacterium]
MGVPVGESAGVESVPATLALRPALLLALCAGALLPFALAPFDLAPLAPLSFALVLAALRGRSVREALLVGWVLGLGRYGVGVSWVYVSIHEHGNASVLLAGLLVALFVAFMALFPALAAAAFAALRARTAAGAVLAFTGCQLGLEWLLTWFLTGFPWLFAGHTQLHWPLAGWAPVLGALGVTLFTVLTGGALWALWHDRGRSAGVRVLAAAALLVWLAG